VELGAFSARSGKGSLAVTPLCCARGPAAPQRHSAPRLTAALPRVARACAQPEPLPSPKDLLHSTACDAFGAPPRRPPPVSRSPPALSPSDAPLRARRVPVASGGSAATPALGTPRLSQLTSSELGLIGAQGDLPPPRTLSLAKARDLMTTNVLCGEEKPALSPVPTVQHQVVADPKTIAAMTLPELRVALRSRGLSPAGAHATLVERMVAGLQQSGTEPLLLPTKDWSSGVDSSALAAAYARADGALAETPVHRGQGAPEPSTQLAHLLANQPVPEDEDTQPAAHAVCEAALAQLASHISFGEGGEAPQEGPASATARGAHPRRLAEAAGNSLFTAAQDEHGSWSELKAKEYAGSGIFAEDSQPPVRLPGVTQRPMAAKRSEQESHVVADGNGLAGVGEAGSPAIALSQARSAELLGEATFTGGAQPLPSPPAMCGLKAAELGSSVFEDSERSPHKLPSPDVAAGRSKNQASSLFSDAHLGPQAPKEPSSATATRVGDIYAQGGAQGCTMAFATAGEEPPRPTSSSRSRRSSGGGVSSIVFG